MIKQIMKWLGYEKIVKKNICHQLHCGGLSWKECTSGACKAHCGSYCKCLIGNRITINIVPKSKEFGAKLKQKYD